MDLLFKKYASPFSLLDSMIYSCRFAEFVHEFVAMHNEETKAKTSWEFYLHKVSGMTYEEFMNQCYGSKEQEATVSDENLKATVNESKNILKGFNI